MSRVVLILTIISTEIYMYIYIFFFFVLLPFPVNYTVAPIPIVAHLSASKHSISAYIIHIQQHAL